MRDVLTAASAAGVAVVFGSPIGRVLFSIEEMSPTFSIRTMWRSFLCALIATVTLSAMNPFRTGKLVLFQVTYDRDWHFFEMMFFVILGIFGGLYGAIVIKLNMQFTAFRRKHLVNHAIAEAVVLVCLTAMIGYFNRFLQIDMTESLAVLFRECESGGDYENLCQTLVQWPMVNSLFLAMVIRIGLVIISYGSKVPTGIFVPSMAIGASFGRMVGIIVKAINRSVMRLTVTIVVIMFELTGALNYILPTMIVLLVMKAIGDMLGVHGIADEAIRFNGYPFLEKNDHFNDVPVPYIMCRDLYTLAADSLTLEQLETFLDSTSVYRFPIVTSAGSSTLVGHIGCKELVHALDSCCRYVPLPRDTCCVFVPSPNEEVNPLWSAVGGEPDSRDGLPLEIMMQLFKCIGPCVILVEEYGALIGLSTVKDVLHLSPEELDTSRLSASWTRQGGFDGALEEMCGGLVGALESVVGRLREWPWATQGWW
ncbi:chloride channel [Vararia minispora EC-137]|uniref:Chloride channel n=1 Tax=Vararia minispora EC-137 TaxID=1314806 RepID=A0ACB8Q9B6_9AGAM|nr:chloride channel [Vararia minispora EC-137]